MLALSCVKQEKRYFKLDNSRDKQFPYYYIYALERAGVLYGTEKFGDHEWYPDGAKRLLKQQDKDGSWSDGKNWGSALKGNDRIISDTCLAILFLCRATRPLVASEDNRK